VHGVDHNLFDQVEVGETGELHIIGCMVLDKILVRGGCRKFVVFFAKLMMVFIRPRVEHCKELDRIRQQDMHNLPPARKVAGLSFSCVKIQQSVQKLVWEWDTNPPIL